MIENLGKTSKWDYRFFHLYADGKRIREVDVKEVRQRLKLVDSQVVMAIRKNQITLYTKGTMVHFKRSQLFEVLNSVNSEDSSNRRRMMGIAKPSEEEKNVKL